MSAAVGLVGSALQERGHASFALVEPAPFDRETGPTPDVEGDLQTLLVVALRLGRRDQGQRAEHPVVTHRRDHEQRLRRLGRPGRASITGRAVRSTRPSSAGSPTSVVGVCRAGRGDALRRDRCRPPASPTRSIAHPSAKRGTSSCDQRVHRLVQVEGRDEPVVDFGEQAERALRLLRRQPAGLLGSQPLLALLLGKHPSRSRRPACR